MSSGFRRSAVLAFVRFGAVLIGLYAVVAAVSTALLEDRLLARRLELEAEAYEQLVLAAPGGATVEPPRTRFMRGYLGIEAVPEDLRPWVEDRPAGTYEAGEDSWFTAQPYLVAIRDLPGGRGRLFLVYDVTLLGEAGEWLAPIGWVLLTGALAVGLLGAWWGRRLANDLVAPVVHLAETVAGGSPETLASRIEVERYPGEVGHLAAALRRALERVEAFVRRERRFTRNASHELRTPVTVARGAAELLATRLPAGDERAHGQLDRLRRSIDRMEEIIEAFVWLAREDGDGSRARCRPAAALPRIVEQHRHLLADRPVEVALDLAADPELEAPEPVLAIAVGNLIANAFDHTLEGRVLVRLEDDAIQVSDTGSGIPPDLAGRVTEPFVTGRAGGGLGLGLTIVREICERFGWRLELAARNGGGTHAEIRFAV